MKKFAWLGLLFVPAVFALSGCGEAGSPPVKHAPKAQSAAEDPNVKANLAKLSDEDRKLAEAQKYCAVERENRLGAMGTPVKLMINDQPVFLCCKSCQKEAPRTPTGRWPPSQR